MDCIIDVCINDSEDERYTLLGLWGTTAFFYPINAAIESKLFNKIYVRTDDAFVKFLTEDFYGDKISILDNDDAVNKGDLCVISGKAVMLTAETLVDAYKKIRNSLYGRLVSATLRKRYIKWGETQEQIERINAFYLELANENYQGEKILEYLLSEEEAVLLQTKNDFELLLVLINKKNKAEWLKKSILNRIEEKRSVLNCCTSQSICLIGHSQFDQWDITELGGYVVQNCGISGISSFEYRKYILDKKLLKTDATNIIMIHGTNDIVYDISMDEIVDSIRYNVRKVKDMFPLCTVYFVQCIHVNGRLDRSNKVIDELNTILKEQLNGVHWISTVALDDDFGNLKREYTRDGLHLSREGYDALKDIIEDAIK